MRALLLAFLILVPACSPQAAGGATSSATATTAVHPASGLEVIPLKITTPTGKAHSFHAEVARTPQEQAKGLMFRTEMGPNEGMLFPYAKPQLLSFWMKNTVLSLDLIFIGEDRRIINIAANATPYSETPIPSDGPGIAVLELNGGRAAQLGLVPGSKVEW
jgi:uncharacterized membrane protein (UPF0127 family)